MSGRGQIGSEDRLQGADVKKALRVKGLTAGHIPQRFCELAHDRHKGFAFAPAVATNLALVPQLCDGVAVAQPQGGEIKVLAGETGAEIELALK